MVSSRTKFFPVISLIKREEIPAYYRGADAVFGNFKLGTLSSIEREAAACSCAVLAYCTPYRPEYKDHPFLKDNDPHYVAQEIDRIVRDKEFRTRLADSQYSFILNNHGLEETVKGWNDIFQKALGNSKNQKPRRMRLFITLIISHLIWRLERYSIIKSPPT